MRSDVLFFGLEDDRGEEIRIQGVESPRKNDDQDLFELYYLYLFNEAKRKNIRHRRVSSLEDLQSLSDSIRDSGGGVLVSCKHQKYRIRTFKGENNSPRQVFATNRGGDVESIELRNSDIEYLLPKDERLIVPTSQDAVDRFSQFSDDIRKFPAGSRALLYQMLRSPDIDARLRQLEFDLPKPQKFHISDIYGRYKFITLAYVVVLLLSVVVGLGAVKLAGINEHLSTLQGNISNLGSQMSEMKQSVDKLKVRRVVKNKKPPVTPPKIPEVPQQSALTDKIISLVDLVQKKAQSDVVYKLIWDAHFSSLPIDNTGNHKSTIAQTIDDMVKNQGEFGTDARHSHFQWGLLKLWLVEHLTETKLQDFQGRLSNDLSNKRMLISPMADYLNILYKNDKMNLDKDIKILQGVICQIGFPASTSSNPYNDSIRGQGFIKNRKGEESNFPSGKQSHIKCSTLSATESTLGVVDRLAKKISRS